MKLLLTSSGIKNKSIAKTLANLLNKQFEKSNIVFIPTASTLEVEDKHWLVNDMYNAMNLGFKNFYITDISVAPKDVWFPQVKDADVILVGGGNTEYLKDWMEKSGFEKSLPEFLKTKVYVGISAGSIVTAETINMSSAGVLYYEDNKKVPNRKGLGFVPFEIRPHLNSKYFPKVTEKFLGKMAGEMGTFYAIDDETAIQVVDGKATVISEGKWEKFN